MTDQNDDVFSGDSTPQDTGTNNQQADLFAELVGEGKKFKTPQDLAKSRIEQDNFIEQLKSENAQMREELKRAGKIDSLDAALARLNDKLENASGEPKPEGNSSAGISREDILAIIREDQARTQHAQSRRLIQEELVRIHGDTNKVREFLRTKAAELKVTTADLAQMVERTPVVARQVLGLTGNPKPVGPTNIPSSTRNTEAAGMSTSGVRNQSYYNNLRKELGSRFYEVSIQQQMFKDRKALGEKFNE